eukprot:2690257-Pleurochrysis_carterae.AAC.1
MTRARAAVRSACKLRAARDEGPPPRHWSSSLTPKGPARPNSAARRATPAAPAAREPAGACWCVTKAETSARQPPTSGLVRS